VVASQGNHADTVSYLLSVDADISAQMIDGASSLFLAAQNGHKEVLEILLEEGASPKVCRKVGLYLRLDVCRKVG